MAKYLVTGGAGFIGTNLVKELIKEGHEVVVLDNFAAGKKEERIQPEATYIEGDIRNEDDLKRALEGVEGVFHLAALPRVTFSVEKPQLTHDVNVNGTLSLLLAARDAGVKRFIFSSSSSVYGGVAERRAVSEDEPKNPKSPYALQKLTGQEYCRMFSELFGIETVSLCYFNIYGPYMDPEGAYALVIGKFLMQRAQGTPLTICGDGEYYRDYTHVADVVRANILAMQGDKVGKGEFINIGNNSPYSVNQLAELIGGETAFVAERPGDVRYAHANNTKAKELLGWEPSISLEDGIASLKSAFGVTE